MGFLGKTTLEKLSTVLLVTIIMTVLLFIFRYFLVGILSSILVIILCPIWFRSLSEELVVAFLKRSQGQCTYEELTEEYSEKMASAISRLKKKSIVEIKDNEISLIDENYVCTFDKFRRKHF